MRQIRDLKGRMPAFRHRRWQSHRCPAAVAVTRSTELARVERNERRRALGKARCKNRKGAEYVCPALRACLKPNRAAALERRSNVEVTPLAAGVDTLWLYTTHPLSGATVGRLEVLRGQAQAMKQAVPVQLAGVELGVQARRLSKGRIVLSNDFFDIVVCPEAEREEDARVRVELRSLGLWSMGWKNAAEKAIAVLEVLVGATRAALDVQVSRVDICEDFQGWQPTLDDRPFFHTRARAKGRYYGTLEPEWDDDRWIELEAARLHGLSQKLDACRSVAEQREVCGLMHRPRETTGTADYDRGRTFTGFAWGLGGTISARAYDKTLEAFRSRKGWMRAVWRQRYSATGVQLYKENRDKRGRQEPHVWRLEFQFRREALKEFQADPSAPLENLGAWEKLKDALPRLWRYCTRRWLRHGRKQTYRDADGVKRNRFVESFAWVQLASEFDAWEAVPTPDIHREAVATSIEAAMPQLVGYAAQVSAAMVERGEVDGAQPFHGIMTAVLQKAFEHARGELEARFEEKHDALRARRRLVERYARARPQRQHRPALPQRRYKSPTYDAHGRGQPLYVKGQGIVWSVSLTDREVGS